MKIKSLLLWLCVAFFALDASAYYKVSKSLKTKESGTPADRPFVYEQNPDQSPFDADEFGSKWHVRSYKGGTTKQTLIYLTKDENGNVISKNQNTNGHQNGTTQSNIQKDESGIWSMTAPIDATYKFNYNFATDKRPLGRDMTAFTVKVITGTPEGNAPHDIKVRALFAPSKFDGYDGEGSVYHWAEMILPQPENSMTEVQTLTGNIFTNDRNCLFAQYVKLVDITFENVKAGDKLAVVGFEAELGKKDDPSWLFAIPTINSGVNSTPNYSTFPGPDVDNYKVIHIQAEDFDESWVNGHVAHSPVFGEYPDGWRRFEEDANVGTTSHGGCFTQFGSPYPTNNEWTDDWGPRMPGRFYENPQYGVVANMHKNEDWGAYTGEYLDETSNKVSFEQAADNFGAWLEYTFDAEEDMNLDLSFRAASHWFPFTTIKTNGSSAEGKPREEGGFEVEGIQPGYLQQYSHALMVFIDGKLARTNWDVYPKYVPGMTEAEFAELAKNPQQWTNYQEMDAEGNAVNSPILHLFPWPDNVNSWDPYEKWQMVKKFVADPTVPQAAKSKITARTVTPTSYIRPDYADIPVEKGRHTIKVQSLGGQWMFDDMKLIGKPKNWENSEGIFTSVDEVEAAPVAVDENAPVEIYNLQGVRMGNEATLTPGIYVKRQGNQVVKFVVR